MSMIEFHNVQKYYGNFHALKDINLKIDAGETVVLIGPSGSGKSSLIRTINGLDPIRDGQLIVNGYDLADKKTNVNLIRKDVGMVFQHFNLYNNKNVLENIMLAPRVVLKRPEEENKKIAMQLLEKVGLADKADNMPSQLSGGQKQRIAIARSLAMNPKCLLFDEPTSALDPEYTTEVLDIVNELKQEGMDFIIVTHEMGFAIHACEKAAFLCEGRLMEYGPSETLFHQPETEQLQGFLGKLLEWEM